jgi:hypothetical protein
MQWKPVEMGTKGSPKNRWEHEVLNDLKKIKSEELFVSRQRQRRSGMKNGL